MGLGYEWAGKRRVKVYSTVQIILIYIQISVTHLIAYVMVPFRNILKAKCIGMMGSLKSPCIMKYVSGVQILS